MRKLKFRVWDNITRKFDPITYNAGEQFGHPSSCDWSYQQYTGLKDKDDKEIYEGDILCYRPSYFEAMTGSGEADIDVVEFKTGAFQLSNCKYYFADLIGAKGMSEEIIGNIYENPELLKPQDY